MDNTTIRIRPYKPSDFEQVIKLFQEAVKAINIRHYSPEQITMWTMVDSKQHHRWQQSLQENICFVATIDSTIIGFADMSHEGYLDRLYVHKDYQARFVAYKLFKRIEQAARSLGLTKITTHCSITAKVPAERMGFKVIKEQTVTKNGVEFINYIMEKIL